MFFNFFIRKIWLVTKMLFSYSSYQVSTFFFFFWQKYLFKILILLVLFSFIL